MTLKIFQKFLIAFFLVSTCSAIDQGSAVKLQIDGKEVKGKYLEKSNTAGYIVLDGPVIYYISIGTGPEPSPNPNPDPNPEPNPDPDPNPDPIPGKLFVLGIAETSNMVKLPLPLASIITSLPVREYLTEKCATDDSGIPAFRFYDPKADLSKETKDWQDIFKKAIGDKGTSETWLIITNGTAVYEGPWPSDQKQMLELLKKYGG